MKKIGILTFHYVNNYGAVLQVYALRKVLNSFSGYEAEIINYVPEGYEFKVYLEDDLMKLFVARRKKFESFLTEKCGVCTPMIHTLRETHYDYYCVGSDQVWNTNLSEARDYVYFLGEIEDKAVKFSYAASIGMDLDKVDKRLFQKYISRFSYVGIREQSYVKEIRNLCGIKCVHNVDPTLLLQKEAYEKLIDDYGKKEELPDYSEPYVLYIWYGEDGLKSIEFVNTIARKYGLTILHNYVSERIIIRKMLCRDGGYIFDKGIEEFLWYVKHADFVVSNSFHVGIFSLIFERPVYMYTVEGRECRQRDLSAALKIENRVMKGYIKSDDINKDMDYDSINACIEKEREHSLEYLKKILLTKSE